MHADEFRELVAGTPADILSAYLGADPRTLRRWKSGEVPVPAAVARLVRLRFQGDVSALLGKDWDGYRFGSDGLLYVPGWRGGFDPHAIKAMFFGNQLVRHHQATIRALEKRIGDLERDLIEAQEAAAKYRSLVSHEARLGLMLERITG